MPLVAEGDGVTEGEPDEDGVKEGEADEEAVEVSAAVPLDVIDDEAVTELLEVGVVDGDAPTESVADGDAVDEADGEQCVASNDRSETLSSENPPPSAGAA